MMPSERMKNFILMLVHELWRPLLVIAAIAGSAFYLGRWTCT